MTSTQDLFSRLVDIIRQLRDPETGCPWDKEQTHASLKPFLIEEAYETLDAIDNAPEKLPEELGDVLLQVLLHAQIGSDEKAFSIDDVITILSEKMIHRHPHIFGDESATTPEEVIDTWEKRKEAEGRKSTLSGVPSSFPALLRCHEIGRKVARVGFDWDSVGGVQKKVAEEAKELLEELMNDEAPESRIEEEFGDLLFTLAQLARKLGFHSEELLQKANDKFIQRFEKLEELSDGNPSELSRQDLEELWKKVKAGF